MVRKATIPIGSDNDSFKELLNVTVALAGRYGDPSFWYWDGYPYFWCWKGEDRTGHDLILGWNSGN